MKIKYLLLSLLLAVGVCAADIDSFDNEEEVFEDAIEGNLAAFNVVVL